MSVHTRPFIETASGEKVYLEDPTDDTIWVDDIAHSLAMQCRFTGHVKSFYSIAEHCITVSRIVPEELALEALFHDAHEAYISDIASPIKRFLTGYKDLEARLDKAIAIKLDLDLNKMYSQEVKMADRTALVLEAKQLLVTKGIDWVHEFEPIYKKEVHLNCLLPWEAKRAFIERYEELISGEECIQCTEESMEVV